MSDIITIGVIGLGNAGTPILNNLYKFFKIGEPAFPKPITPIVMISLMISPFVI